jgi:hypothetical protein
LTFRRSLSPLRFVPTLVVLGDASSNAKPSPHDPDQDVGADARADRRCCLLVHGRALPIVKEIPHRATDPFNTAQHRRGHPFFPLALPFFAVMALNYRRCCDSAKRQCHLDLPYVQGQIAPAVQAGVLSNFLDCSLRARAIMSNPSLVCY